MCNKIEIMEFGEKLERTSQALLIFIHLVL
jgi:hypothetical protein